MYTITQHVVMRILFFLLFANASFSQSLFYQDIYRGGVTASGTSSGVYHGAINSSIEVNIPFSSTIRKAYLIFYNSNNDTTTIQINFNGQIYNTSLNDYVTNYLISASVSNIKSSKIFTVDVTNSVNSSQNIYPIQITNQQSSLYSFYGSYYLVITYENPMATIINLSLILNNQELINQFINYNIINLNPINYNSDIGLAIHSDILWDTIQDGTDVYINGSLLGLIGGSDQCDSGWIGAGSKGSFYYFNNLVGLDDDVANNLMSGSDCISRLNNYIFGNNFLITLKTQSNPNHYNNYISFPIVYSTNCLSFPFTHTPDTTVCAGAPLQLQATGGINYEWTSAVPQALQELSCTNCPNPVFTGDTSRVYMVRIWNTDSCSVVRPIRIKVLPKPTFSQLTTLPSDCGGATGVISAASYGITDSLFLNTVYSGIAPQSIPHLGSGTYTLYLKDTNGCKSADSIVSIGTINIPHALFSLNPTTGTAPLTVSTTNQSTNASNYQWTFLNNNSSAFSPTIHLDTSGTYTITLVAYSANNQCTDTFSVQIMVYDSLQIVVPNIVSPNHDGINDQFSIHCNQPLNIAYSILNRWGNVITEGTFNKQQGNVVLWNITDEITDGVYFYKLTFSSENSQIQQQLEQAGATKTGYVELVR